MDAATVAAGGAVAYDAGDARAAGLVRAVKIASMAWRLSFGWVVVL